MRKTDWHGYIPFRFESLLHTGDSNHSPRFSNHYWQSLATIITTRFEIKLVSLGSNQNGTEAVVFHVTAISVLLIIHSITTQFNSNTSCKISSFIMIRSVNRIRTLLVSFQDWIPFQSIQPSGRKDKTGEVYLSIYLFIYSFSSFKNELKFEFKAYGT